MSSASNIGLKSTAGNIATLLRDLRPEEFFQLLDAIENASEMASKAAQGKNSLHKIKWRGRKTAVVTLLDTIPGKYFGSDSLTAMSSGGSPMPDNLEGFLISTIEDIKNGLEELSCVQYANLFEEVEKRRIPTPNVELPPKQADESHHDVGEVSSVTNDSSSETN